MKNIIDYKRIEYEKNAKYLILIIVLIISLIVILLIINTKRMENKKDEINNSLETTKENQNEQSSENKDGENNNMDEFKINITINGTNYTATLEDNNTTREFIKRLPLEINMDELNGNEKFHYFNDSLPSNSSRINKINSGDLMLYGSDCLVLFYESFNTSYSYTRIGRIDNPSSLKEKVGEGSVRVSFTK